ncbi:hypothetical protein BaOVIS_005770 [Babesia ovis]|uniref:UBA domain-containing protein n=1 Tax=Babesia ovis TaxID=5869 RepID=A0A9W5WTS6_BABOV|nr:hypothetical protein BaOVIS_005770 [Babesia ovis]
MPNGSKDGTAEGQAGGNGTAGKNTMENQGEASSGKKSCTGVEVCENADLRDSKDNIGINAGASGNSVTPEAISIDTDSHGSKAAPSDMTNGDSTLQRTTPSQAPKSTPGGRHDYDRRASSMISQFTRRLVTDTPQIDVDELLGAHQSASPSEEDQEERMSMNETNRMLRELTADSELMSQVMRAATNPEMAKELARQADTAWRNIEALPGGFRALCQMHRNIQQPLWQAMMNDNSKATFSSKKYDKMSEPKPSDTLNVESFPNPWATPPSIYTGGPGMGSFDSNMNSPLGNFGNLLGSMPGPTGTSPAGTRESPARLNLINTLHSYLASAGLNPSGSSSSQNSAPTSGSHTGVSVTPANASMDGSVTQGSPTAEATTSVVPSEEKYAQELQQMLDMGLEDRDLCLTVLEASDGDIFAAINLLQSLGEPDRKEPSQQ